MKKLIRAYILSLGGSSHYAGNTINGNKKTLFITDPKKGEDVESIESAVLNKFGFGLPFTLKTN